MKAPVHSSGSTTSELKRIATRGALWIALTSAAALPLGYYRNWVLGRIGEDGTVVGNYAVILLFVQIVVTFVLFGGSSVLTNFLPKIERPEDKSAFMLSYGAISILLSVVFTMLINLFPVLISLLIRKPVDSATLQMLSVLVPVVVMAQVATYCLAGMMEFRLSSLLAQLQLFSVCLLATTGWLYYPGYMTAHALSILAATVGMANGIVVVVAFWHISRRLAWPGWRHFIPPNFWRFSSFVHLNSVSSFIYQSIDQLVILTTVGTAELGTYFILLQCAQLIAFVPQRIGQVMLASFSHLVAGGGRDQLCRAYNKLCRIILIMSTVIALSLVFFSHPLASIFGPWCAERHLYLLALAAAIHLGALGSVNSMLIMAKERTGYFLTNSLVLIGLQLLVTLLLLERWGVYAVIAGKAVGIVSGQIGLFSIIRWRLDDIQLSPPREFWIGIGVVLTCALLAVFQAPLGLLAGAAGLTMAVGIYLGLIGFRISEITTIIKQQKKPTGEIL